MRSPASPGLRFDLRDHSGHLRASDRALVDEIIREAIARYEPPARGDRDFALAGCVRGPGDSIADLDVDELMCGFGA